jgi:hypothetical protein
MDDWLGLWQRYAAGQLDALLLHAAPSGLPRTALAAC